MIGAGILFLICRRTTSFMQVFYIALTRGYIVHTRSYIGSYFLVQGLSLYIVFGQAEMF